MQFIKTWVPTNLDPMSSNNYNNTVKGDGFTMKSCNNGGRGTLTIKSGVSCLDVNSKLNDKVRELLTHGLGLPPQSYFSMNASLKNKVAELIKSGKINY